MCKKTVQNISRALSFTVLAGILLTPLTYGIDKANQVYDLKLENEKKNQKIDQQEQDYKELSDTAIQQLKNISVLEQQVKDLKSEVEQNKEVIAKKDKELAEIKTQPNFLNSKVRSSSSLTEYEYDFLCRLVEAEAGDEPYNCKIAVVNVVFNRVNSPAFPSTLMGVITQKNQFEPVGNGIVESMVASSDSKKAVNEALAGVRVVDKDVIYFWADYLDNHIMVEKVKPIKKIGTTYFGKEWSN